MKDLCFPWKDGYAIGSGFNFVTGEALSATGFAAPDDATLKPVTKKDSSAYTKFVSDDREYAETVTAAVTVKGSGWGATAGGTLDYLKERKFHTTSIGLVSMAQITTSYAEIAPSTQRLSDYARDLLTKDPAGFFKRYGTYFISGWIKGGTFIGTYMMRFKNESSKDSLTAKINAAFTSTGMSASLDSSLTKLITDSGTSVTKEATCVTFGTTNAGEVIASLTCEDISKGQMAFNKELGDGNQMFAIVNSWTDLDDVDGVLREFHPDYVPPASFEEKQQDTITHLSNSYHQADYLHDWGNWLADTKMYAGASQIPILDKAENDTNSFKNKILDLIGDASKVPAEPDAVFKKAYLNCDDMSKPLEDVSLGENASVEWQAILSSDFNLNGAKTSGTLSIPLHEVVDVVPNATRVQDKKTEKWILRVTRNEDGTIFSVFYHDDAWSNYGPAVSGWGVDKSNWSKATMKRAGKEDKANYIQARIV
jgi:hypothetical protein